MVEKWKGVRPLRYRGDVFAVLNEIEDSGRLDIEKIRVTLIDQRAKREEKRLTVLRISRTTEDRRRKRDEFLTKAEQVVRVLRRAGLVQRDGKESVLSDVGHDIVGLHRKGDRRADALFIESLLNSPFRTYWLFLKSLAKHKIRIPRALWTRDRRLRRFIRTKGFPMDVWSFFILRDLFYEFGLLNYVADDVEETFALFKWLPSQAKVSGYLLQARTPEGRIFYWPSLSPERFLQLLAETYLSMTGRKWNRVLDLIELRERFSVRHSVPEIEFNQLFEAALNTRSRVRLVPSVGYIRLGARRGYLTKAVNLPTGSDGLPLAHIRIEQLNQDGNLA